MVIFIQRDRIRKISPEKKNANHFEQKCQQVKLDPFPRDQAEEMNISFNKQTQGNIIPT